jgi:hypothetical protein
LSVFRANDRRRRQATAIAHRNLRPVPAARPFSTVPSDFHRLAGDISTGGFQIILRRVNHPIILISDNAVVAIPLRGFRRQ